MPISFPASPTVGQLSAQNGRTYVWTSRGTWELTGNVAGHAASHAAGGSDAITPASIGAAAVSHTHTASAITDFATAASSAAPVQSVAGKSGVVSLSVADVSGAVSTSDSRLSDARTPTTHAAAHAAGGSDALALAASQITTGALDIARIPTGSTSSTVCVGNDARLSDARTPSGAAGGDLTGSYPNPTLATIPTLTPGSYGSASNSSVLTIDSKGRVTSASSSAINISASQIGSGTISDARLSSNVPLLPGMMLRWGESSTAALDVPLRGGMAVAQVTVASGTAIFHFFTPLTTITVSQITMGCHSAAASGLTLARMGLYTFDESVATLVARTASDTTLFTATRTLYTRSLDTAGGYPATYTLQAGVRYGVAVIAVGTTGPSLSGIGSLAEITGLAPRVAASRASQTDLPASVSNAAFGLGATLYPWARLS